MSNAPSTLRGKIADILASHGHAADEALVEALAVFVQKPGKAPPAAERYRWVFKKYPTAEFWGSMAQVIGEDPAVLEAWEAHCQAWHNRGYRCNNYEGLFDSFKAGGLNDRNQASARPAQSKPGLIGNSLSDEGMAWANAAAKRNQ